MFLVKISSECIFIAFLTFVQELTECMTLVISSFRSIVACFKGRSYLVNLFTSIPLAHVLRGAASSLRSDLHMDRLIKLCGGTNLRFVVIFGLKANGVEAKKRLCRFFTDHPTIVVMLCIHAGDVQRQTCFSTIFNCSYVV